MKVILILCALLIYTGLIRGQGVLNRVISVHVKEMPVQNLLDYISEEEGIYFTYTGNITGMGKPISLNVDNIPLKKLLNDLFFEEDLSFTEYQNQIILKRRETPIKQYHIRGIILASESVVPVEYASIQLKKSGKGVVAGYDGKFEITASGNDLDDTLSFYCVGYEPRSLSMRYLTSLEYHTIYLNIKNIPLDTIVKTARKPEIREEGIHGIPFGSLYLDTHGQQVALYIDNDKHVGGRLKSVRVYLSGRGNAGTPFRIRVFAKDANSGGPGIELLPDILIIHPKNQKGWFSVDMQKYNIRIPDQGFFISMEGIYPGDYIYDWQAESNGNGEQSGDEEELNGDLDYGQRIGFSRLSRNNTWHYSISHTWFQLKKKYFNIMISAEILVYDTKNKNRQP